MHNYKLSILLGTASLLAVSAAQTAFADTSSGVEEITVTAERHADIVKNVPFSVTAISAQDLAKSGVTTTAELPELVTGLTWGGQGPWMEPSLRGVTTTVASPGAGSPIALYLDGVYQPQQISTIMDLPDVTSIEVDKGPQGTLFGRNTTGGAIQINTQQPSFTPMGHMSLNAGFYSGGDSKTADHVSGSAFFSGPISDNVAFSLSTWAQHTPGYIKDLVTGRNDGETFSAGARGKLLWQVDANTSVLATAYYAGRRDLAANELEPVDGYTAAASYPDAVFGTKPWTGAYSSPSHPRFTLGDFGSSVQITHYFDGVGAVTSTTGYNNYKPHVAANPGSAYSPDCNAAFACVDFNAAVPEQALSQELLFNSDQFGRLQFVSGVFGFYDRAVEDDRASGGPTHDFLAYYSDATHFTRAFSIFTEANYKITDDLTFVAGLRYNTESLIAHGTLSPLVAPTTFADKTWNNLSPRFSLKYAVNDDLNLYATYSQGFKAGVASTGFLGTIFPPANPEKLTDYEVGAKYASHDVTLNASFFYYDYKNLQGEFFNGLETYPFNVGSASMYGIDADAAVQVTDAFQLKGGFTWLPRARYDRYPDAVVVTPPLGPFGLVTDPTYNADGKRMVLAPDFTATLTAAYTKDTSAGIVDASTTLYYSSDYNLLVNGLVKQDGYVTLNAEIGITPASWNSWRIGLYGHNLTDKAVINTLEQPPSGLSALYSPPRELGVSLDYTY
jgi:iron complex outermembrane receptor protein